MIYDLRTYTCRAGTINLHLELYGREGFAVQKKHLGEPLLYALTETGPLNTYTHIWVFESHDDRARKRAAMAADPAWREYLKKSAAAGYLIAQENRIVVNVPFFTPRTPAA